MINQDLIEQVKRTDWSKARALGLVPDIPVALVFSRRYDRTDLVSVYVNKN